MTPLSSNVIPSNQAETLLKEISTWQWVTTIIIHTACIFEFKGPFPKGTNSEGFYNLEGELPGFHGHLNLNNIGHISFQDKLHRGQESYAFVFETKENELMFKIFLGRDDKDQLIAEQVVRFKQLQQQYSGLENE